MVSLQKYRQMIHTAIVEESLCLVPETEMKRLPEALGMMEVLRQVQDISGQLQEAGRLQIIYIQEV